MSRRVFSRGALFSGRSQQFKQHNQWIDDMRLKQNMIASLTAFSLGAIFALGFLTEAKADDKKADVSGNWTWVMQGRQGRPDRTITAKLKVDGNKVTGTVSSPGRDGQSTDTEIKDGKVTGDEISFSTSREVNGNTMTYKYSGKVSGDKIKGKLEFERNGEPVSRDWEATRAGETK
jgi:hypothetical protein